MNRFDACMLLSGKCLAYIPPNSGQPCPLAVAPSCQIECNQTLAFGALWPSQKTVASWHSITLCRCIINNSITFLLALFICAMHRSGQSTNTVWLFNIWLGRVLVALCLSLAHFHNSWPSIASLTCSRIVSYLNDFWLDYRAQIFANHFV